MKDEEIKKLLEYETPLFAEYVSWNWLQNIIAKYIAWKVRRKLKRLDLRQKRKEYLSHQSLK